MSSTTAQRRQKPQPIAMCVQSNLLRTSQQISNRSYRKYYKNIDKNLNKKYSSKSLYILSFVFLIKIYYNLSFMGCAQPKPHSSRRPSLQSKSNYPKTADEGPSQQKILEQCNQAMEGEMKHVHEMAVLQEEYGIVCPKIGKYSQNKTSLEETSNAHDWVNAEEIFPKYYQPDTVKDEVHESYQAPMGNIKLEIFI